MRSVVVDPGSELFDRVVRKTDTAFFRKSSQNLPLIAGVSWRMNYFETHLNSAFSIDCIDEKVP